jgi:hypothetical protein
VFASSTREIDGHHESNRPWQTTPQTCPTPETSQYHHPVVQMGDEFQNPGLHSDAAWRGGALSTLI